MTKTRPDNRQAHGQNDLFSNFVFRGPVAEKSGTPVKLGLLQRPVVAGFHALTTRKTRQALEGLERFRLCDIGLESSDIDRAVRDAADQASEAFARRLHGRWRIAAQSSGSLNADSECLMCAGRGQ